jgi:beta-lactamase class A
VSNPLISIILLLAVSATAGSGADIESIARGVHGHVGAAALLVESGESFGVARDMRFPMQSVYKLPIAMAILAEVDRGRLTLEMPILVAANDIIPEPGHSPMRKAHPKGDVHYGVRELLRLAVQESDGTASDVLMRVAGGPERIMAFLADLGVHDVMIAETEKAMMGNDMLQYRNWATPDGLIGLLRVVNARRGLSAASYSLLMTWRTRTTTFPGRIKGLLPAGTIVAHKTGTSGTSHGLTRATNDVGIVTMPNGDHLLVAILISDSIDDDATRDRAIARIARAAWDQCLR